MKGIGLLFALVLLTTGSSSGCSWLFVEPLSKRHVPGDFANCTTNPAEPIVDTVFTAGGGAWALDLAGSDEPWGAKAAVGVLTGLLFSSTLYGYIKTSECREANDEAESRQPRGRFGPRARPAGSPQPRPAGSPSLAPAPSVPGQQEDEDEPRERPRPPAANPNLPSSGA
jgi:hypothetical protein